MEAKNIYTGIDGCGVPVFFLSLFKMAWAYSRLAQPANGKWGQLAEHVEILRKAILANPYNIGGEGNFDTELMTVTNRSIIAKGGAEAIFCLAALQVWE